MLVINLKLKHMLGFRSIPLFIRLTLNPMGQSQMVATQAADSDIWSIDRVSESETETESKRVRNKLAIAGAHYKLHPL